MNPSAEELLFLDLLARGEPARMRALGRSMLPWIADGSLVELEPPRTPLCTGDILLARTDDHRLVLHRLIANPLASGRLVLKGDGRALADTPIASERVLGRVRQVEQGWIHLPAQEPGRSLGRLIAALSWLQWKLSRRLLPLWGLMRRSGLWHQCAAILTPGSRD